MQGKRKCVEIVEKVGKKSREKKIGQKRIQILGGQDRKGRKEQTVRRLKKLEGASTKED